MTTQQDIPTLYERATTLLHAEEVAIPPTDLSDWQEREARRGALETHLRQLDLSVIALRRRFDDLPELAHAEHVRWAGDLLAFPNLAFLEVDTDGLSADADLLRIALVDPTGAVFFDQLIQPRHPISPNITRLTALSQEQLVDAPRLPDIWEAVSQAVTGRFVLSFNLEFDQQQLAASARRNSLPPLHFIGACLMLRAQDYYQDDHYPRLSALCERLGAPLPDHPRQDALDRARGQVHLLRMMAQGITQVPLPSAEGETREPSGGVDPFLPDFDENA